jgi:uncharacterized membrane protein
MAFCTKCGASVADGTSFCGACGAPQTSASNDQPSTTAAAAPAQTQQMAENIAGLLSYVLGWITGLIMYFVDKRPYVRFHAAQSIVVFGALHILLFVFGMFFGISLLAGGLAGFTVGYAIQFLISIAAFVLWMLLMVKAYQGERFRVPLAADIAERIFGKA